MCRSPTVSTGPLTTSSLESMSPITLAKVTALPTKPILSNNSGDKDGVNTASAGGKNIAKRKGSKNRVPINRVTRRSNFILLGDTLVCYHAICFYHGEPLANPHTLIFPARITTS